MLPEIECPRIVDIELPLSDEMVDNGRGMNSRVSENPTRAREGDREAGVDSPDISGCRSRGVAKEKGDFIDMASGRFGNASTV